MDDRFGPEQGLSLHLLGLGYTDLGMESWGWMGEEVDFPQLKHPGPGQGDAGSLPDTLLSTYVQYRPSESGGWYAPFTDLLVLQVGWDVD